MLQRRTILFFTWINQTTFSLYNSLFTIQLAIWSHSLCFLPYIDTLYSAICSRKMEHQARLIYLNMQKHNEDTQWTFTHDKARIAQKVIKKTNRDQIMYKNLSANRRARKHLIFTGRQIRKHLLGQLSKETTYSRRDYLRPQFIYWSLTKN